ncbi:hypothetical protein HHI36_015014 [Cryptolaemus montrouzieri]|uniref:Uncharacterized protein n=1 Tax=Cryptolaemus montrouzieri TaxID=559131 RepID=A0ABD2N4G0_9CUCU
MGKQLYLAIYTVRKVKFVVNEKAALLTYYTTLQSILRHGISIGGQQLLYLPSLQIKKNVTAIDRLSQYGSYQLNDNRWKCLFQPDAKVAYDSFQNDLLIIFNDCFPEKTIKISEQSKSKPEKETQEILILRNQIEAARTVASVKKDEATFGFLRFLEKQLKEQIEKQIRADDAKKLAESDNKNRTIWEIIKSRTNSKCDVTSESLLTTRRAKQVLG